MIFYTNKHRIPVLIDDSDWPVVSKHIWCIDAFGYPIADGGKIKLHHMILGRAAPGLEWDHINRNKLDNRRENLRQVTRQVNIRNQSVRSDNQSGHRGVAFRLDYLKWRAVIYVNKRQVHLGDFKTIEEAITARREAEERYWGNQR